MAARERSEGNVMRGGNSRCVVLVVDDEPPVLHLVTTIFTRAGFEVIGAAHAEEALAVLSRRSDVAVLFTDCDMPGMKGPALAHVVKERWPSITILLTSGKPVKPDEFPQGAEFIGKPFRASSLLPKLEAMRGSGTPLRLEPTGAA
jgi:DNA-binding NtrC family response regulator